MRKLMPKVIGIEISRGCNRSCHYCPKSYLTELKKNEFMPMSRYKQVVKNLSVSGIDEVDINLCRYGEPLMPHVRPFLIQYLSILRKALPNSNIWLYTNGDYLTPELEAELKINELTGLIVTNHGGLNIPWFQGRVWEINDLVINSRVDLTGQQSPFRVIQQLKRPLKIPCYEASFRAEIRIDGSVGQCCEDGKSETNLGNIFQQLFDLIWFSDKYNKVRNRLEAGDRNHGICKLCCNIIPAHQVLLEKFHCAMQNIGDRPPRQVADKFLSDIIGKNYGMEFNDLNYHMEQ